MCRGYADCADPPSREKGSDGVAVLDKAVLGGAAVNARVMLSVLMGLMRFERNVICT